MEEQKRLARELPARYPIHVIEGIYEPKQFYEAVKGLEKIPEGGERCFACFALRLKEAARLAAEKGFDFFTTTLTISPLKNAAKINEIGQQCAEESGVVWLPTDFKKKEGYKRSIELSAEYGLYRQDYCGCVFSRREREEQKRAAAEAGIQIPDYMLQSRPEEMRRTLEHLHQTYGSAEAYLLGPAGRTQAEVETLRERLRGRTQ